MQTQTQPERATADGSRRLTLIAMSLGFCVVQLDVSVVNVAVKSIGASIGGGVSALQLIVSAYTVTFAAFILTAGALGDRIGAKRLFIAGFVLFTLASVACGLAPSLGVLVAARAVQGIGAAVLVPSSLTLLNHTFREPGARARAIGFYLAGASLSLSGGPLVGGVLISTLGWRSIFFINVPVAIAGIYLTIEYAHETPRASGRGVDPPGQLAAVVALVALVIATIEGGVHGFGDPLVLAGFAVFALAAASFVMIEHRSARPMLPLALFRSSTFSACALIGLLINTAFYGLIFVFSLLFQREQHLSPLQTGLALAPVMVAVTVANLASGSIAQRLGPRAAVAGGAVLVAAGCAGLLGHRRRNRLRGGRGADVCTRFWLRRDRPDDHVRAARLGRALMVGRRCGDAEHASPGRQRDRRGPVRVADRVGVHHGAARCARDVGRAGGGDRRLGGAARRAAPPARERRRLASSRERRRRPDAGRSRRQGACVSVSST